jgi:uncharacterized membrane protein
MRTAGASHLLFAVTLIALGILGLVRSDFAPIWQPVPDGVPARAVLVYLCALILLVSGVGLLWRRGAPIASRALFVSLLAWLLLLRVPHIVLSPTLDVAYAAAETAVMVSASWILYIRFNGDRDRQRQRPGFATGDKALRVARALYSPALILFGVAHFLYLDQTAPLVPGWLPWHVGWAYFTGAAFIAAGVAVLFGVLAQLATALAALQIGSFTLLVWVPIVVHGANTFQWHEFIASWTLTAGAWVIADSYCRAIEPDK